MLRDVPSNFQLISQKIFGMMNKHGDAVFSTDTYAPESTKVAIWLKYIRVNNDTETDL